MGKNKVKLVWSKVKVTFLYKQKMAINVRLFVYSFIKLKIGRD